jgi:hypothetical protein
MIPIIEDCKNKAKLQNKNGKLTTDDVSNCWIYAQYEIINNAPINYFQNRIEELINKFIKIKGKVSVVFASSLDIDINEKKTFESLASNIENKLYYTDTVPKITPVSGTTLSIWDVHPNQKGHLTIVKEISKYITNISELGILCNN